MSSNHEIGDPPDWWSSDHQEAPGYAAQAQQSPGARSDERLARPAEGGDGFGDDPPALVAAVELPQPVADPTAEAPAAPGHPTLVDLPAPSRVISALPADQLEHYIIAGIHQDRSPGNVLVVLHPAKRKRLPDGLFEGLAEHGFAIHVVETHADHLSSIRRIRDKLHELAAMPAPLDVIVIGGDGTLDHHFLLAAFAAFYPERVRERPGVIQAGALTAQDLAKIPEELRRTFALDQPIPSIAPTDLHVKLGWVLRSQIEPLVRRGAGAKRIARRCGRKPNDPLLRLAVLATILPTKVTLQGPYLDLGGLAEAPQSETFRGLYPWIRSIVPYPAGTAADNAVFAGVPGLLFGLLARPLRSNPVTRPLAKAISARARTRFVDYFTKHATIVPARLSLNRIDGRWQRVGSHAAGGPGSAGFFSGDLVKKTRTLLGYLVRIPRVVLLDGVFGTTLLRVEAFDPWGRSTSVTEGGLAEGLFSNRPFLGGVGSLPTTTPTSFGGESSLLLLPSIVGRSPSGARTFSLRAVGALTEAILKGVVARIAHQLGFNPGRLAGEGEMSALQPEHQVALKEGGLVSIHYAYHDGEPRAAPIQISGDPFQAHSLAIKVFWGPVPLLASHDSLLLTSTRGTLAHLRLQQSYGLKMAYIGGVHYFRHESGPVRRDEIEARTGLVAPPLYLPLDLAGIRRKLCVSWQRLGTGDFVDTSEPGRRLRRKSLYCHNNDQSCHLLLMRIERGDLLVRQVRRTPHGGSIFEARTTYRQEWGTYVISQSQVFHWPRTRPARILQEERFFRDAAEFQMEAPAYFPVLASTPGAPTLPTSRDEPRDEPAPRPSGEPPDRPLAP